MTGEEICNAAESSEMSARDAVSGLVKLGYERPFAEEMVFITLGGDDLIETGDDGIARYYSSGLTVDEVQRRMDASYGV